MANSTLDKATMREEYDRIRSDYETLRAVLKEDLQMCLDQAEIRVLSIESRVKKFDSLWEKAQRRQLHSPLDSVQDLCGLRIICYYPSDVEPVCREIENALQVIHKEDKRDLLGTSRFGYLSLHFIVTPGEQWLEHPRYKGLNGRKAEIQVRTIFQHAWAELSHELTYKKEEQVPKESRRRVSQLSAMLENLDEQFDELHRKSDESKLEMVRAARNTGQFNTDQDLNIDSLQALLDFRFPDKVKNPALTSYLLGLLHSLDMSMGELLKILDTVEHILPLAQAELVKVQGPWYRTQPATVLTALALANDHFARENLSYMPRGELALFDKWRAKLSDSTAE